MKVLIPILIGIDLSITIIPAAFLVAFIVTGFYWLGEIVCRHIRRFVEGKVAK